MKELRHDRHTVSLLTDHMVFAPKYSLSFIAKRLKGRTSRILRKEFPILKLRMYIMLRTLATGLVLKSGVCDYLIFARSTV